MWGQHRIGVIIPALDEERAIGGVLDEVPHWVDDLVVVDNGSTDRTAQVARQHGARVALEPARGYGAACLHGISALQPVDVVVFLDGDHADRPSEMERLLRPIAEGRAQLVIGSRTLGQRERGALSPQARAGNAVACSLIWVLWRVRFSDLGPFRAITSVALQQLRMADRDYGWTVEMQVKAAMAGLATLEVPVSYRRRRLGRSKVSGSLRGVVGASFKILGTIARLAVRSGGPRC